MRQRILGLVGGKRRRRVLLGTVASTALLGALLISSALAVHDENFQLDGDVLASTTTNVGGQTQNLDWDSLFDANGDEKPLPPGFTASVFSRDFNTNANGSFNSADATTYATGSKDTLPISGWQCASSNNVGGKVDIMNAYSAAYTAPNGDEILYFGQERNSNDGDANVGFWFLQDGTVDCTGGGGATDFTGHHQDGDLFIVSAFTRGGTVSTIDVYRWNGDDTGSLGTTPVAHGADCTTTSAGDTACATVNSPSDGTGGTITTPWLTANKDDGVGHSLRTAEFYEGGVNLTQAQLGGKCFSTFISNTRSSQSLTATLFDYDRGALAPCVATMKTEVSDAGPVTPGTPVHDTATVQGTPGKPTPTGDVTFHLCKITGPVTDCSTGGDLVGSPVTLQPVPSTPENDASAQSADVNTTTSPLSPGRYCFRADWPGDDNYPPDLTVFGPRDADECFTVKDVSSITTAQKWLPQDEATVTTAGGTPVSGTVEFSLYENGTCSGTAARTFTDSSAPFETDNTTYRTTSTTISWSAKFTPTDPDAVEGSTTTRCERSDLTINNSASPFPPPTP